MDRAAERIRSIVDEESTTVSIPLPSYIDEIQALSSQLRQGNESIYDTAPASPHPDIDVPGKKVATPVRSNRKSVSPNPSKTGRLSTVPQLMDLVKHGRALSKQQRENISKDLPSNVAVATDEQGTLQSDNPGSIVAKSQPEKKVTISAPGESFFEGVSTDIPSPIKGEVVEAWDWTDQWSI